MSVELHLPDLPDLPEVPIKLGAAGPVGSGLSPARGSTPFLLRLRDLLSAYLPLLVMALLALASWWLVKHSPHGVAPEEARAPSADPDYTMSQFAVERFDATGRLELRIEGQRLRHFPAADRIEIDEAQFRAYAPDGRVTLAHARQAIGNGDGSEVQLLGGAEVSGSDAAGVPLVMRGEFLHAFLITERVKSHLPVQVSYGGTELRATGLDYDHALGKLDLLGPMRAVLTPREPRPPRPPA